MGIVGLGVGANQKRRATLRGGAASLHATTGSAFVTPVEPRHTLVVRTERTAQGEGA